MDKKKVQLIPGCIVGTTRLVLKEVENRLKGLFGNAAIRYFVLEAVMLVLVSPVAAESDNPIGDILYPELKKLLNPLVQVAIFPIVPALVALSATGTVLTPLIEDETQKASIKAALYSVIKCGISAEIILALIWVIMRVVARVGGISVS